MPHPVRPATLPLLVCGLLAVALCAVLQGCARPPSIEPGRFYPGPLTGEDPARPPVVVIPALPSIGLIEAVTGRVVWDPSALEVSSLAALPMRQGASLAALRDDLRPSRDVSIDLIDALRRGGYRPKAEGGEVAGEPDLYRFAYDWRRDLVESAAELHRYLLDRRADLHAARAHDRRGEGGPIKFDLVAQGSGGLLLRYYLRYGDADLPADGTLPPLTWAGADLVGRAILVGPPNAGTIGALLGLAGGKGRSAVLPGTSPLVLGTFPSIYQLLPRGRHGSAVRIQGQTRRTIDDLFDARLWENLGWGLASSENDRSLAGLLPLQPDPVARRRIALDHLHKCLRRARRFCEALDVPGHPPAGLSLHLLAGDATPTDAVAGIDWATGSVNVIEQRAGDGVVLRSSALLDERVGGPWSPSLLSPVDWSTVMFFHVDGAELGRDAAFIDNLLYLLLEQPRRPAD